MRLIEKIRVVPKELALAHPCLFHQCLLFVSGMHYTATILCHPGIYDSTPNHRQYTGSLYHITRIYYLLLRYVMVLHIVHQTKITKPPCI